jgi:prolyl-tRNA synthetase
MKMSMLFSQTLRETPAEAETDSHKLLLRAGFIRQLASGVFSALPLAARAMSKIEALIRQEMDRIGGQELRMPVVHPAEIWQESGRWQAIGAEMGRFKDRNNRDMVLGMTHEEVVADLARREVRSYRQMPLLVYQIQTKWRDDPRPRAGLIRVREFTMKDSYSLDADWQGLERQYRSHYQAYFNIFGRCGLPVVAVGADSGMMGGKVSHEYMYLTAIGEDTLMVCPGCGFAANRQVARFQKAAAAAEEALAVEKVATPHAKTIAALAQMLHVSPAKTAKAVLMMALMADGAVVSERFVFAVVRGDMDLNETKLSNALGARELRPASEEEIRRSGAVAGYASPIGLARDALVVVDEAVTTSPNLVAGANEEGYHLLNTNYGRDYSAQIVADLAAAREGDGCPQCGSPLGAVRGVEVGNIFQLGTRFSEALGCTFLDKDGQKQPIVMGSYGIGIGRLLACIAEEHHDAQGLVWPVTVAPYAVHLVALAGKNKASRVMETAEQMCADLQTAGVDVLFDDREESPGIKFNDADLLGMPLRITVGERGLLQGQVECKRRDKDERELVALDQLQGWVKGQTAALHDEIAAKVKIVPFR